MVDDIGTLISGIITSLGTLIDFKSGQTNLAAYAALFALPVLGGVAAFGKKLIKKAR